MDTLKLIDFFTKHKVAFKSVTEPFDTATPLGQAMLGMLSTFAQFERILDKVNELEAQIHSKATTYSHLLEATLRKALAGG